MAGYSPKSLAEKLGLAGSRKAEAGGKALFLFSPPGYRKTLGALPAALRITEAARAGGKGLAKPAPFDFIHIFCRTDEELGPLPSLQALLARDGMLWVSWPKQIKGRKPVPGALNEARVREAGLAAGLVDVKVCAVDETWSGLKFVFRLKDRP